MYLLYSAALSLLFLALLPYFILQAARQGKYAGSFRERLGRFPPEARSDGRPTIWLHAVSVGEFLAARPLISALHRDMPRHRIVVSTTTLTGQRLARTFESSAVDAVFYFPFDWAFAARRALQQVNPSLVILMETELWPNFLRHCRLKGVTTVVANGRFSQRSFDRYRIVRWFISHVINDVSILVMQSDADADRASRLGAKPERLRVCGNIKYDVVAPSETAGNENPVLDRLLGLCAPAPLVVAGSTAPGEEQIVLDALGSIRGTEGLEETRLVIAPRHPERFDEVAHLIARSGFQLARRSAIPSAPVDSSMRMTTFSPSDELYSAGPRAADVILLDSMGELAAAYQYATVVFVGGSLVPRGGHNIIEPAAYAKPTIVGPHVDNFRQVVADFTEGDALVQTSDSSAATLASECIRLLSDREKAEAMGRRARAILDRSQGATDCTIAAIRKAMNGRLKCESSEVCE